MTSKSEPVRPKAEAETRAGEASTSGQVKFTYGPLTRIVNVHWAGGLAVEFFNGDT